MLVLAPVAGDAAAMAELLNARGFLTWKCQGPAECVHCIATGAGALLMTEEALKLPEISTLLDTLKAQPEWSELPLIIATNGGESRMAALLDLAASAAGTITLLERPMSAATLWRSVEVALRSRHRQYQVRDLIEAARGHAVTLEKAVAERTAELRAANEQLETFVYSIAHDLRAPLRSMTAYAHLLVDDHGPKLDADAQRMLQRIRTSSEFMDRLLIDLLAYGRAARVELEIGPVETQRAWQSALFQCASQIEQTRAQIETVAPLPKVRAHEATLGQILANLLSNALKFVPSGIQPRVRFRGEKDNPMIRLWVEDNGIGIAPEHRDRVFRVFERLNGPRYPGTGIGLSIVRKGVERMGGHVGLESAPGRGTRFWIELPKAA